MKVTVLNLILLVIIKYLGLGALSLFSTFHNLEILARWSILALPIWAIPFYFVETKKTSDA
jgi:hypothetical protein